MKSSAASADVLELPVLKVLARARAEGRMPHAVLLTGNEAQGLPADYAAACDLGVKMPMRGRADSLNAAVATAVMAYQVLAAQDG